MHNNFCVAYIYLLSTLYQQLINSCYNELMNYPSDLLQKIKAIEPKHKTLLIGIDGFGGAGKTALSTYLHDNLPNSTIVQLDDFYLPTLGRADRGRVIDQILTPLEKDMTITYEI